MDISLWVPDQSKPITKRLRTLEHNSINYYAYDGPNPGSSIDLSLKVVKSAKKALRLGEISYLNDKNQCFSFNGGGRESVVGLMHFHSSDEVPDDILGYLTRKGLGLFFRGDQLMQDVIPLYAELHLLDKGYARVPSLDQRFYFFAIPGRKYVERQLSLRAQIDFCQGLLL
jgi:hypothetical protein